MSVCLYVCITPARMSLTPQKTLISQTGKIPSNSSRFGVAKASVPASGKRNFLERKDRKELFSSCPLRNSHSLRCCAFSLKRSKNGPGSGITADMGPSISHRFRLLLHCFSTAFERLKALHLCQEHSKCELACFGRAQRWKAHQNTPKRRQNIKNTFGHRFCTLSTAFALISLFFLHFDVL